jgi:prepilin-type N-terminal cleavage/methylation domain-containing protein
MAHIGRDPHGYSLVELIVSLAIMGFIALVALPALGNLLRKTALRAAIERIHSLMLLTQEEAVALQKKRAIKFIREDGRAWSCAIYDDGDGDGVRNDDIAKGTDPLARGPESLISPNALATIAIDPDGLPDPDGGRIPPESSPVRFNRSSLCSFAPDGSCTPGSVYLHAIGGGSAVVRCSGDGGCLTILVIDKGEKKWRFP